jgi:23S rRNA pseudouridine1911/1915/1917 synthase
MPRPTKLNIIYEDHDLLVINKPPGLLTSTTPREKRPTLSALVGSYLEQTDPRARVGLIHRLDKDAAGLLVFSKNNHAYHHLKTQFFHHTVKRIYHAVVLGIPTPKEGTLRSHLVETTTGKVHSTKIPHKGQRAITHYQTLATSSSVSPVGAGSPRPIHPGASASVPTSSPQSKIKNQKSKIPIFSLLRLTLETGRKHQLRAHLSEKNHPILNDSLYGPQSQPPKGPLMLLASHLTLTHPRTQKQMTWTLPLPHSFHVLNGER